jgi:hypothetical protein
LGKKRRLVFLLEWDTRLPVTGRFPVNSQTLDMTYYVVFGQWLLAFGFGLPLLRSHKPSTKYR